MKKLMILIVMVLTMSIVACSPAKVDSVADDKMIIAVSIVPQETFVKAVVGDHFDIVTLIPPGYSPENHEPKAETMAKLEKASIYFAIGVPTEDVNILPYIDDTKVVALHSEAALYYPDREFEPGFRDPHIWLSPKRVKVMIDVIAQEVIMLDPDNEDLYLANAEQYKIELDKLDETIKESLSDVSSRKFIAYHPAFGYLADDYDLTMYVLEEEGKEATPQHLQDMVDLAIRENIKAVFYQSEIDSSQSKAFAEEIDGVTIELEPLAEDYIPNLLKMIETLAEVLK